MTGGKKDPDHEVTGIEAISRLPEGVSMEEIMYKLYGIDKINKGKQDIEKGNLIDMDKLKKEIENW